MRKLNIAIDGPAGAGKSTVAKQIAKKLGIIYLDTGAMYRAVALKAINSGIDTLDERALEKLIENIDIKVEYDGREQIIYLDGINVNGMIRSPEVSIGSSNVALFKPVRLKLAELQRGIARKNDVVMDGRDIGTYVLPDANVKIFLTASVDERARRRFSELQAKGAAEGITLDNVKRDIEHRDKNDSGRDFAPLSKAPDAIEIDSTDLSADTVVAAIIDTIQKKRDQID